MKKFRIFLKGILLVSLLAVAIPVQGAAVNSGTKAGVTPIPVAGWPAAPDTFSETAVLMDADSGAVLFNKGMDEIRYPASITKLMTLLLAVENSSLKEEVTFTETSMRNVTPDSGNIGMQVGEKMSMKSCLYAAIIRSANEVSTQIAEHVGGTEANFIQMMNDRAKELGCKNTNFVNASGMPDDNHYSTAYDMALIMREGLKNKNFRRIIGRQSYKIPATNMSEARKLHTHLPLLAKESPFFYEGCLGGKTGVTLAALNTLVVAAERNGTTYIAVTMRNPELSQNCSDSRTLFDYGFQNFEKVQAGNGTALVPVGTDPSAIVVKEEEVDGEIKECYYLSDYKVGMGTPGGAGSAENADGAGQSGDGAENADAADQSAEASSENSAGTDSSEAQTAVQGKNEETGLSSTAKLLLGIMAVMVVILVILCIALGIKENKNRKKR